MPLVTCPDCGREISSAAPACIQCGRPLSSGAAPAPQPAPATPDSPGPVALSELRPVSVQPAGPRYAGFGPRFLAALVDLMVYILPAAVAYWASRSGVDVSFAARFALLVFVHGYLIVTTAIWGQTLGKRAAGIQVRVLDGSPVGLGRAFLRDLIPLVLAVVVLLGSMVAAASLPAQEAASAAAQRAARPEWATLASWGNTAFSFIDMIVFFVGSRWRALHDLIAGTVVVYKD